MRSLPLRLYPVYLVLFRDTDCTHDFTYLLKAKKRLAKNETKGIFLSDTDPPPNIQPPTNRLSAPNLSNSTATSSFESLSAQWKGVYPFPASMVNLAPCSASILTEDTPEGKCLKKKGKNKKSLITNIRQADAIILFFVAQ